MSGPRSPFGYALKTLDAAAETTAPACPAAQIVGRVTRVEAPLPHLSIEVARGIAGLGIADRAIDVTALIRPLAIGGSAGAKRRKLRPDRRPCALASLHLVHVASAAAIEGIAGCKPWDPHVAPPELRPLEPTKGPGRLNFGFAAVCTVQYPRAGRAIPAYSLEPADKVRDCVIKLDDALKQVEEARQALTTAGKLRRSLSPVKGSAFRPRGEAFINPELAPVA